MRAIVDAGGTIDQDWPIEKAFATGDRATGTHVLTELYGQMRDTPKPVDLGALWKQLGVKPNGDGVRLLDTAPLANVRKAITMRQSADPPSSH